MTDFNFDKAALYRNGIMVLLLVFVVLIVHEIFGANGLLALRQQQKERQTLQEKIQQLQQENERLEKQVKALKSDPAAIERVAREQMHLAKPGELIYTLPEKDPSNSTPPVTRETPAK